MTNHEIQLTLDGNNAFPKTIKNAMSINRPGDFPLTSPTSWTSVRVNAFNNIVSQSGVNLTLTDGYIKIGKNIDYVIASATINIDMALGNQGSCMIYKNGAVYNDFIVDLSGNTSGMTNLFVSPILIPVVEGDLIGIGIRFANGYSGNCRGARSILTVFSV